MENPTVTDVGLRSRRSKKRVRRARKSLGLKRTGDVASVGAENSLWDGPPWRVLSGREDYF